MNARDIAAALGRPQKAGRGWRPTCPVHAGFSLNVADGRDGKLLVKCWAPAARPKTCLKNCVGSISTMIGTIARTTQ